MCVCVCVYLLFVCVSMALSPINTERIITKFRMEIPVHHAECVRKKIEHMSKVKVNVTKNMKITVKPSLLKRKIEIPIYQKYRRPHDIRCTVFASCDIK